MDDKMESKPYTLFWEKPDTVDNVLDNARTREPAIYSILISRGGKTQVFYVGYSTNCMNRLKQHRADGEKFKNKGYSTKVTFAPVFPRRMTNSEFVDLLEDIESMLIYTLEPKKNCDKKYHFRQRSSSGVSIINSGYRIPGIKKRINTTDLLIESKNNPKQAPKKTREVDDWWNHLF